MPAEDPAAVRNEASEPLDAVVQAGTIHGGVHLHHAERAVPLRQLPMAPVRFVNRLEQLGSLDAWLAGRTERTPGSVMVTAVAGAPGTGKTTLAVQWAHRVRHHFPDGDLYLDLRGYGPGRPLTSGQAVEFFLHSLGLPTERIPLDVDLRAALYRSLLDGRRVLIVIDNAADAAQVRPLIPASPTCLTVITSRDSLSSLVAVEGVRPVVLDVLTPEESLEMLGRMIGDARVRGEPDAALRIVRRCGYLPPALRIVAERPADQDYLPLAELADELDDEYGRLDALASGDDDLADVRAVFSWSYHRLPDEAARLFRLLGPYAGADIGTAGAAALSGRTNRQARRLLGRLAGAHLVQQVSTDRYRLHDLLRAYATERAEQDETPAERRQAARRITRWYLLSAANARRSFLPDLDLGPADEEDVRDPVDPLRFTDRDEAMAWFETERFNLVDALRQAGALGEDDLAAKLPKAIAGFFEIRAYWSDYRDVYAAGLRAARAAGSSRWELANLVGLGDADRILNHDAAAMDSYRVAAALAARVGNGRSEGFALRGIGLLHERARRFDDAIGYYERALATLHRAGARRGEGMCLLSLGDCHRALDRVDRAVDFALRALAVFRETDDRLTRGLALTSLGRSLLARGRPPEAIARHREALAIFRQYGHPHKEALSLLALAEALDASGESAEARDGRAEALLILERINAPEAAQVRDPPTP